MNQSERSENQSERSEKHLEEINHLEDNCQICRIHKLIETFKDKSEDQLENEFEEVVVYEDLYTWQRYNSENLTHIFYKNFIINDGGIIIRNYGECTNEEFFERFSGRGYGYIKNMRIEKLSSRTIYQLLLFCKNILESCEETKKLYEEKKIIKDKIQNIVDNNKRKTKNFFVDNLNDFTSKFDRATRLHYQGKYNESIKLYLEGYEESNRPEYLYNASCGYARLGDLDNAFKYLKKALDEGYSDKRHIESDLDMDNLRSDSRYKLLLGI